MNGWAKSNLNYVRNEIEKIAKDTGSDRWASFSSYLVEPYLSHLKRGDQWEPVLVVARVSSRVVFFEDVEENFCIANEDDGRLYSVCDYVDLRVAINEALRESGDALIV